MKALSLTRPWTTLVLHHGKGIENRSWGTSHRGPLLIHGAKSWNDLDLQWLADLGVTLPDPYDRKAHPTGLLGTVEVLDVCRDSRWMPGVGEPLRCDCGPWAFPGQSHWKIRVTQVFPDPVPCTGAMGLWTPPADVLALVPEMAA